jgi:hypothetical protein
MIGIPRLEARVPTLTMFAASKAILVSLMKDVEGAQTARNTRRRLGVANHRDVSEVAVSVRVINGNIYDEETPTRPTPIVADIAHRLSRPNHPTTAVAMKAGIVTESTSIGFALVSPPQGRTTTRVSKSSPPPQPCLVTHLRDRGVMLPPLTTPGNVIDMTEATTIRALTCTLDITTADPTEQNTKIQIGRATLTGGLLRTSIRMTPGFLAIMISTAMNNLTLTVRFLTVVPPHRHLYPIPSSPLRMLLRTKAENQHTVRTLRTRMCANTNSLNSHNAIRQTIARLSKIASEWMTSLMHCMTASPSKEKLNVCCR